VAKKGHQQVPAGSTCQKKMQNKRATIGKNSPRCSGGGCGPAAPPALAHGNGPKRPPAAAFRSDNKHIAVMNSSGLCGCGGPLRV